MGKIPLSFIMRREFINISSYLTAVICQQTIHSSSLEILIFLGHLFASCDRKQEIAGILCWNATLSCGQKFGKSPRNANFLLLLRKEKANRKKEKKKKACQTKEKSDNIYLFKITYNCLRERKLVQKALMCTVRRDHSV